MVQPPAGIVLGIILGAVMAAGALAPSPGLTAGLTRGLTGHGEGRPAGLRGAADRQLLPFSPESKVPGQARDLPQLAAQILLAIEQMETEFVALVAVAVLQAPSETSRLVATLAAGDRMLVTGRVAGREWYRVYLKGAGVGYVRAAAVVETHGEELGGEPGEELAPERAAPTEM
jgi:hypothetical protein